MGQLRRGCRVEDRHLDRADRPSPVRFGPELERPDDGRVVELHVSDLESCGWIGQAARAVRPFDPRRDVVRLLERVGQRFLDEDRKPAIETGQRRGPVRARSQHDERVDRTAPKQVVNAEVPFRRRHPITLADRLGEGP